MGTTRNGARSFLDLLVKVCKLSHLPGFKAGLDRIIGHSAGDDLYALWTPLCDLLEGLQAADDHFNRKDNTTPNPAGGEDTSIS